MTVRVGRQAPDVRVDAYVRDEEAPRTLAISELRGRWVVLFFYPRDFTFVCPTEIQAFGELEHEFLAENAIVVGASTDSFHSHKAWFGSDPRLVGVAYPVIADTTHALAEAFDVLKEDGAAMRGTFIIDPEGIVRHMQINDDDVGRNVGETLRTLRALRTGALCPQGWLPGEPTLDELREKIPA